MVKQEPLPEEFFICKDGPWTKQNMSAGDAEQCFSIWRCRNPKAHAYACKTVEGQRTLERKSKKVLESIRKIYHKLNNDGHGSALRRLAPNERDKLKQFSEADEHGLLICPEEAKGSENQKLVPQCGYIIDRIGGYGKASGDEADALESCPSPPPPPAQKAPQVTDDLELVELDQLQVLKKDEDEDDFLGTGTKQKKPQKSKKEKNTKKYIDIVPRSYVPQDPDDVVSDLPGPVVETSPAPSPTASPTSKWGSPLASPPKNTGWGTVPSLQPTQTSGRPMDWREQALQLSTVTGCSEAVAAGLLEQNGWNADLAANAYFSGGAQTIEATSGGYAAAAARNAQPQPQQHESSSQQHSEQSKSQQSEPDEPLTREVPAPPSQQPPPKTPPNWKAVWHEDSQAYYFWNTTTNDVQWEEPDDPDREQREAQIRQQQEAERAAERAAELQREQDAMTSRTCDILGVDSGTARQLLQDHSWSLEQAVRAYTEEQRRNEERRKQEEAARRAEEARAAEARRVAEEARRQAAPDLVCPGQYVVSRHWRPRAGAEGVQVCLRLFHGERAAVSWVDGQHEGWAYGYALSDPGKEGYFPQSILKPVKHNPLRCAAGMTLSVRELFEAPPEIGGYLTLSPGDIVRVLHPLEEPFVWAYVELLSPHGPSAAGWVPEVVLCDSSAAG
eukprot:gnl/TRDRNA2_/TRDRNA2_135423_c0_seq1.p1 gnl/TRDRNA2_/TRDRNA2_135423_c0~~gnl/TRDRNA2_/TRDRNA2_135423_c0_seq1.p1  ORF type:complete len:673 (-),score=129.11 gnl/TRDRNA2_/TRDRNA2_135423_c0_seq1:95-2113(-)